MISTVEMQLILQKVISKSSVIIRGQVISILIAGTGIFATFLSNTKPKSTNFPTLMSLFNYSLLATYMIRILCRRKMKNPTSLPEKEPPKPIYWYILAAILDMEANYLVILAYNYTTITSVMLLDCFTIPSSMLLSYLFLSYTYTYKHIIGAIICIVGLIVIVITDITINSASSPPNALLGDIFCLTGSLLYAASNVLQEHMVKSQNREEYLGWLGVFGVIIAFIQCIAVDLPGIEHASLSWDVWLYITGFVTCLFLMYTNTSMFLIESDATLFNLSLLTSDVYAVIFSYFLYSELVHWAYFIAFGLVVVGLYIYHKEVAPDKLAVVSHMNDNSAGDAISSKYTLVSTVHTPLEESSHSLP